MSPDQPSAIVATDDPELTVWSGCLPVTGAPQADATRLLTTQPPSLRTTSRATDPGQPGRFDAAVTSYRRASRTGLSVPTVADSLTEGAEWLRLEMSDELGNPVGTPVSGRVTDG